MAYKNILANKEQLSIIELRIDEENVNATNPEYLIENKHLYIDNEGLNTGIVVEESDDTELLFGDFKKDDEHKNKDESEDDSKKNLNLFS